MKKTSILKKTLIGILLFSLLIVIYFFFIKKNNEKKEFYEVKLSDVIKTITITGKIEPPKIINLSFEKSGLLTRIFKDKGDKIKKGELLAQIDSSEIQEKIKIAKLDIENEKLILEKINFQKEQFQNGDILDKNCKDGLIILSNFYKEAQDILNSLNDILFEDELEKDKPNIEYYAEYQKNKFLSNYLKNLYNSIQANYKKRFNDYQLISLENKEEVSKFILDNYALLNQIDGLITKSKLIIRYLKDIIIESNAEHEKAEIIKRHFDALGQYGEIIQGYLKEITLIKNNINSFYDKIKEFSLDIKNQEMIISKKGLELEKLNNDYLKTLLFSPIDGLILNVNSKVGEIVNANWPLIELMATNNFEIVIDVYEEYIPKVNIGIPVKIKLTAFPEKEFNGKISFIDKKAKIIDNIVYYEAKVKFDENDYQQLKDILMPSMTVDVIIETDKKEGVLAIPRYAIKRKEGKDLVEILVNSNLQEKEIKIGLKGDEMVEVIEGLQEKQKILLGE